MENQNDQETQILRLEDLLEQDANLRRTHGIDQERSIPHVLIPLDSRSRIAKKFSRDPNKMMNQFMQEYIDHLSVKQVNIQPYHSQTRDAIEFVSDEGLGYISIVTPVNKNGRKYLEIIVPPEKRSIKMLYKFLADCIEN